MIFVALNLFSNVLHQNVWAGLWVSTAANQQCVELHTLR